MSNLIHSEVGYPALFARIAAVAMALLGTGSLIAQERIYGPFGSIDTRTIYLEPPSRLIDKIVDEKYDLVRTNGITWTFQKSLSEIRELFHLCGVSPIATEVITQPELAMFHSSRLVSLRPSVRFIQSLTPTTRMMLYQHIGDDSLDNHYRNPMSLSNKGIENLVNSPSLSPDLKKSITNLFYPMESGKWWLSDINVLYLICNNRSEATLVFQLLKIVPSLHGWFDWSTLSSDRYEGILNYWNAGGRNAGAANLLKSALESPAITRISLNQLMPPHCRELLHTYPSFEESRGSDWPDCFSTSFTFFEKEFSYRAFDGIREWADERYQEATFPLQLGDIIMITDDSGEWTHACNHVAGDIVFTKNGVSSTTPWVFARVQDVLDQYQKVGGISVSYMRLKPEFRK